MFKINKSSVRYMDQNMAMLVVQDIVPVEPPTDGQGGALAQEAVDQAKLSAQKIESNARTRAEQIIQDATQKAQQLVQEAWKQGFAAGKEAGLEAGRLQIAKLKEQESGFLKTVIGRFDQFEAAFAEEAERALLELSMEIAEKVVNNYVDRNDTFIVEIIRAALKSFEDERKVIARISAFDYDRFLAQDGQLPEQAPARERLNIVRDEAMKQGDCIVECDNRIIDAGIDSQLAVLRKALLEDGTDGDSK